MSISLSILSLKLSMTMGTLYIPLHLVAFFSRASVILALISSWISSSFVIAFSSSSSAGAFLNEGAQMLLRPCLGGNWLASRYILM